MACFSRRRHEKGKLTAKSVKERLKDIKGDKTADEEGVALNARLKLLEQEKEACRRAKEAKTVARYEDRQTLRQAHRRRDQAAGGRGQMAGRAASRCGR